MDDVLHPGIVRVAARRHAILPAHIVAHPLAAPIAHVERRIRQDEIGAQVFVQIIVERVGVHVADVAIDAANRQIHLAQPPRRRVRLLPVDRQIADAAAVRQHETSRSARTSRPTRSTDHTRGHCTARSSRPATSPRPAGYRTRRRLCPPRWRNARGNTRTRGPAHPSIGWPDRPARSCRSDRSIRRAAACRARGGHNPSRAHPSDDGFSFSIAIIASSINLPIVGCLAFACRVPSGLASAPRRHSPQCTRRGLPGPDTCSAVPERKPRSGGYSVPLLRPNGAPQTHPRCTLKTTGPGRRAYTPPSPCARASYPPPPRVSLQIRAWRRFCCFWKGFFFAGIKSPSLGWIKCSTRIHKLKYSCIALGRQYEYPKSEHF